MMTRCHKITIIGTFEIFQIAAVLLTTLQRIIVNHNDEKNIYPYIFTKNSSVKFPADIISYYKPIKNVCQTNNQSGFRPYFSK